MWGKVRRVLSSFDRIGITPTHVGKRFRRIPTATKSKDHPHPCGEKSRKPAGSPIDLGSPPPMWGKVGLLQALFFPDRITPTHVGKSIQQAGRPNEDEDHPHPCGEKIVQNADHAIGQGSPPPMWGKEPNETEELKKEGITPTHVGKRFFKRNGKPLRRDHPHPCGEKLPSAVPLQFCLGSPPPMWGKVSLLNNLSFRSRITPTHVGKRFCSTDTAIAAQDHPHPCGEKFRAAMEEELEIGSPPPMWGKGKVVTPQAAPPRITPTHVGKSEKQWQL